MSGSAPTTRAVEDRYWLATVNHEGERLRAGEERARAEFRTWLAEHDAKVRAEAMQEAALIVADLRPTGLAVLTRPGMRSRDATLWEAQSAVQRRAREIEKEAGQ